MFKRAVVPLDGSELAEAILPFIMEIAGPLDLELVLVQVVRPTPPQVMEGSRQVILEDGPSRMQAVTQDLARVAARLEERGIRVEYQARRGDPVAEIIAAARETGADLIAMTTHGRNGVGRLLFGSVAEAVLRNADVPVFLMRLTAAKAAALAGSAG